jgi:transposase
MTETLTVLNERVDDIPLLLAQLERMDVPALLDEYFPTHGNWTGLRLGWVAGVWLAHILSEADHRLHHVQTWAARRLETLHRCTGLPVGVLDFSDDRLANVLRTLSDDVSWSAFESRLTQHLLRVYDLRVERVRLDSTSASGSWSVTPEGLFQFGHSKDRRPDVPQVKVMLAALDPLGLPVATDVLPGQRADDPLSMPAIARVRESLRSPGLLYVGDCKMAALETRACLQAGGDGYLCPLSALQLPAEVLQDSLAPVWAGAQDLTWITRERADGQRERLAEGYERVETQTTMHAGQPLTWPERRLVVRSLHQAQAGEAALRARLAQAQAGVAALNERGRGKARFTAVAPWRQAVEAVLQRYRVHGLLRVDDEEHSQERRVRGDGGRPARVRVEHDVRVHTTVDEAALEAAVRRLGWRVYATNQPAAHLSLSQAVLAYRSEYLIERSFGRLKGAPLSLTPMDVERDDHATGLIRLLSIGLRVLTLLEFTVRRRLGLEGKTLAGLYAGNPQRATAQPTAERLLEAFQELTLTIMQEGTHIRRHLTPLSKLQQCILALLDFTPHLYTRLCADFPQPP